MNQQPQAPPLQPQQQVQQPQQQMQTVYVPLNQLAQFQQHLQNQPMQQQTLPAPPQPSFAQPSFPQQQPQQFPQQQLQQPQPQFQQQPQPQFQQQPQQSPQQMQTVYVPQEMAATFQQQLNSGQPPMQTGPVNIIPAAPQATFVTRSGVAPPPTTILSSGFQSTAAIGYPHQIVQPPTYIGAGYPAGASPSYGSTVSLAPRAYGPDAVVTSRRYHVGEPHPLPPSQRYADRGFPPSDRYYPDSRSIDRTDRVIDGRNERGYAGEREAERTRERQERERMERTDRTDRERFDRERVDRERFDRDSHDRERFNRNREEQYRDGPYRDERYYGGGARRGNGYDRPNGGGNGWSEPSPRGGYFAGGPPRTRDGRFDGYPDDLYGDVVYRRDTRQQPQQQQPSILDDGPEPKFEPPPMLAPVEPPPPIVAAPMPPAKPTTKPGHSGPREGTVRIEVIEAKDLKHNLVDQVDPFVAITIAGQTLKTKHVEDAGKNARWNEVLQFVGVPPNSKMDVQVLDHHRDGDDLLGTCQIAELMPGQLWHDLRPKGKINIKIH